MPTSRLAKSISAAFSRKAPGEQGAAVEAGHAESTKCTLNRSLGTYCGPVLAAFAKYTHTVTRGYISGKWLPDALTEPPQDLPGCGSPLTSPGTPEFDSASLVVDASNDHPSKYQQCSIDPDPPQNTSHSILKKLGSNKLGDKSHGAKSVRFTLDTKGGDISQPLSSTSFLESAQDIVDMQTRKERFDDLWKILSQTIRPDLIVAIMGARMPSDRRAISTRVNRHMWAKLASATRNSSYTDSANIAAFALMEHVWSVLYTKILKHLPKYGSRPPNLVDVTAHATRLCRLVARTLCVFYKDCSPAVCKSLSAKLEKIFFCAHRLRSMLVARRNYKFKLFSPHKDVSRRVLFSALQSRAHLHYTRNPLYFNGSNDIRGEFVLFGGLHRLHGQRYCQASAKVLEIKAVVTGVVTDEYQGRPWYKLEEYALGARIKGLEGFEGCEESLRVPDKEWRQRMSQDLSKNH